MTGVKDLNSIMYSKIIIFYNFFCKTTSGVLISEYTKQRNIQNKELSKINGKFITSQKCKIKSAYRKLILKIVAN